MTGSFEAAGRQVVPEPGAAMAGETALIDELIDRLLALEPLELKHNGLSEAGAPGVLNSGEAKASADSTRAMLAKMRDVLDREAARLGEDGLEGKAAVDQVALIARTLEKIDQMERLIADDQARATGQTLSSDEREQLRQTVRQLILAAAERLALQSYTHRHGADDNRRRGDSAGADLTVNPDDAPDDPTDADPAARDGRAFERGMEPVASAPVDAGSARAAATGAAEVHDRTGTGSPDGEPLA